MLIRIPYRFIAAATFLTCAIGASAEAQASPRDPQHARRIAIYGGASFGGEYRSRIPSANPDATPLELAWDLDPSATFGVRFVAPLHRVITIAADVGGTSFRARRRTSLPLLGGDWLYERRMAIDVSVAPALRYDFVFARAAIEPYLAALFGMTMFSGSPTDSRTSAGWSSGPLGGLAVLTSSRVGVFVEGGWLFRATYPRVTNAPSFPYRESLRQATLRLGIHCAF